MQKPRDKRENGAKRAARGNASRRGNRRRLDHRRTLLGLARALPHNPERVRRSLVAVSPALLTAHFPVGQAEAKNRKRTLEKTPDEKVLKNKNRRKSFR